MAWNRTYTLSDPNSRYYLNPYTLRLEPITTDQLPYRVMNDDPHIFRHQMYTQVMATDAYEQNLYKAVADVSATVQGVQGTLDKYLKNFP